MSTFREYDALACKNPKSGTTKQTYITGDEQAYNHVQKRKQKVKGAEVVFDPAGHREYLTGFRRRKQQRRNIALTQLTQKQRSERITQRAEKRETLRNELGLDEDYGVEHTDAAHTSKRRKTEDQDSGAADKDVMVYQASGLVTTVTTLALDSDDDLLTGSVAPQDGEEPSSSSRYSAKKLPLAAVGKKAGKGAVAIPITKAAKALQNVSRKSANAKLLQMAAMRKLKASKSESAANKKSRG